MANSALNNTLPAHSHPIDNLLPAQVGNNNKVLKTNGSNASWQDEADASKVPLTTTIADLAFNGMSVPMTAGENLAAGDIVYFKSDGKAYKADANGVNTFPAMGLATAAITANASGVILLHGLYRNDALYNLTVGGVVYLSTTAGAATQSIPAGTDDVVQVLGLALHADIFYFNPQLDYLTHA